MLGGGGGKVWEQNLCGTLSKPQTLYKWYFITFQLNPNTHVLGIDEKYETLSIYVTDSPYETILHHNKGTLALKKHIDFLL